ncbi:MAG: hypothetical protein K0Q53_2000, partial [Massilibacillus sp.]|nr:hypothetical protein [Massilibacillus sp.]
MKKIMIIILAALLVLTGCSLNNSQKSDHGLLRYTSESGKINTSHNRNKIDKIKHAFGHTKWNQKKFNNQSGYYSVWIEKDGKKQRKENYRIWIDADSNDITKDVAKIFNPKNG